MTHQRLPQDPLPIEAVPSAPTTCPLPCASTEMFGTNPQ